jgi:hypothetical protein
MKKTSTGTVVALVGFIVAGIGHERPCRQRRQQLQEVASSIEGDLWQLQEDVRRADYAKSSWTGARPCQLSLTRAAYDEFARLRGRIQTLQSMDPDGAGRLSATLDSVEVQASFTFEPFTSAGGDWLLWDCSGDTYRGPGEY